MDKKTTYLEKEEESKAWNISKDFTHEIILKKIIDIDKFRTISIFGYTKIDSDVFLRDENLRNSARLSALKRLADSLKSLIFFSTFALKNPEHKKTFEKHVLRIQKIEENFWRIKDEKRVGGKIKRLLFHEVFFEKIIDELSKKSDEILQILNESGLIFSRQEILDKNKSITQMT